MLVCATDVSDSHICCYEMSLNFAVDTTNVCITNVDFVKVSSVNFILFLFVTYYIILLVTCDITPPLRC